MTDRMKWANALSTRASLEAAVKHVVEQTQPLFQTPADLGLVFISSAFASEYSRLMPLLQEYLSVPILLGCSGGGIVGMNTQGDIQEIEGEPALSLTLARLPEVSLHTFYISSDDLPDLDSSPSQWIDLVGVSPDEEPDFVLLADSMFSGINDLLQGLDYAYPGAVKVGGLANGNASGSGNLFFDGRLHGGGVVGLALSGNVVLETIVAQGCRPIGHPYRVAEGERNIMLKLEEQAEANPLGYGKISTPLEALQRLLHDLDEDDRELAQHSLFVGVAQTEFKRLLEPGDFLIRNLLGVDPRVGAMAIGDRVRTGQRIQFHLRDSEASSDELETLLKRYQAHGSNDTFPSGALMFSCLGRGEGLYGEPNFDSHLFNRYVQNIPVSGFFCGGEIGPIGDSTFLHGYTSVFGICREKTYQGS